MAYGYDMDVVRLFMIATVFWGIVGMLVGVVVAFQLAYPHLNVAPYLTFGRLRPVHSTAEVGAPNLTSAIWLYGGHKQQVVAQIRSPRHGVMPAWSRLRPA